MATTSRPTARGRASPSRRPGRPLRAARAAPRGVIRRALRREAVAPPRAAADPRDDAADRRVRARIAAGMIARGEPAGADARAYWAAVRIWLERRRPVPPDRPVPALRLRPVDAAAVRAVGAAAVGRRLVRLARRRRSSSCCGRSAGRTAGGRSPTAILVALLAFPIAANLDTGNINLLLTLLLFGAQFTGPIVAGLIWAIATWMKWVPVVLWPCSRRGPGSGACCSSRSRCCCASRRCPLTIVQLEALFGFGRRPIRLDYLVFIWALVPCCGGSRPVRVPAPGRGGARRARRRSRRAARGRRRSPRRGPASTRATSAVRPEPRPRRRRRPRVRTGCARRRGGVGPRGRRAGARRPAAAASAATSSRRPRGGTRPADRSRRPGAVLTTSSRSPPIAPRTAAPTPSRRCTGPCTGPTEARGMMSVISAQSTARNMPCRAPNSAAPTIAIGPLGASAAIADPDRTRSRTPRRSPACARSGRRGGTRARSRRGCRARPRGSARGSSCRPPPATARGRRLRYAITKFTSMTRPVRKNRRDATSQT